MCRAELWFEAPLLDKYFKRQHVGVREELHVGIGSGSHFRTDHYVQFGGSEWVGEVRCRYLPG